MENIDQYFRKKLESHSLPVSEQAWQKLESEISPKKNYFITWRIAAAFILGALLLTFLFLPSAPETVELQSKVTDTINKALPNVSPALSTVEDAHQASATETVIKNESKNSKPVDKSNQQSQTLTHQLEMESESLKNIIDTEQPVTEQIHLQGEAQTQPEVFLAAAEKPMVIEFVLEELPESNSETRETGLKKMWETVKEIKNGDRTLDLRQATHYLFASAERKNKSTDTKNQ